jgi:hypothetical protein
LSGDLGLRHPRSVHPLPNDIHRFGERLLGDLSCRPGLRHGGQHDLRTTLEVKGKFGRPLGVSKNRADTDQTENHHDEGD